MIGVGVSAHCVFGYHDKCNGKWGGDEQSPCACSHHSEASL